MACGIGSKIWASTTLIGSIDHSSGYDPRAGSLFSARVTINGSPYRLVSVRGNTADYVAVHDSGSTDFMKYVAIVWRGDSMP